MSRFGRAGVLLVVGVLIGRLVADGGFGWFVQQHMRYPLAAAALLLTLFGAYELLTHGRRTGDADHDHDHDDHHDHHQATDRRRAGGPSVGWLMVLPILVLMSVAPTALGAVAAERVDAYVPTEVTAAFEPLPDTTDPVPMFVIDFLNRAAWDPNASLEGRVVRLEGLVVNDDNLANGFRLTRFMVSCCAADGIPLQVALHHNGPPLENDTWVVADVIWRKPEVPYQEQEGDWMVEADAVSINPLDDVPLAPYESPYG